MSDKPKFCKDCGHYRSMQGTGEPARCKRPRTPIYNLVEGYKTDPIYWCKNERVLGHNGEERTCGPDAFYFEPKDCAHQNIDKYGQCEVCGIWPHISLSATAWRV